MKKTIICLTAAAALALPAAASAHVTLQPEEAPAGGFERLDVRVPNETEDAATTKVEVEFPDGFIFLSTEPVPGWTSDVKMVKLDEPVEAFGEEYTEQVGTVTWEAEKGAGIEPGEFQDFGMSVGLPDAPGEELSFPSLQTYDDDEVVRWIGPPDAEEPAPIVTLTDAAVEHGSDPAAADSSGEVVETATVTEESSDTLSVIALIVGGLGLIAGLFALFSGRRRA